MLERQIYVTEIDICYRDRKRKREKERERERECGLREKKREVGERKRKKIGDIKREGKRDM
jgi:hypothetical protein